VEDYIIAAPDFGRPFLVYTSDPSDPYHVRTEIPMTLMQNADRLYDGPQQTYSAYQHTASQICFYRSNGNWMARPVPIPGGNGEYCVWYETQYTNNAMEDRVGVENFHHLIRVQAALSVLPDCEWRGITKRENRSDWQLEHNTRKDALLRDEAKYQKQFQQFISQMTREQVTSKLPYGYMEEEGFGYGVGTMASGNHGGL